MTGDTTAEPVRVLLVDDYETVRTSMAAVLRSAGFDVVEATDGFIALELLKLERFDAIVLDLMMPVLDGFAVLDGMVNPIPVVLVTANAFGALLDPYLDRVFGVAVKPVAPEVLISLVGDAAASGMARTRS